VEEGEEEEEEEEEEVEEEEEEGEEREEREEERPSPRCRSTLPKGGLGAAVLEFMELSW
jgi:hypothetical protein